MDKKRATHNGSPFSVGANDYSPLSTKPIKRLSKKKMAVTSGAKASKAAPPDLTVSGPLATATCLPAGRLRNRVWRSSFPFQRKPRKGGKPSLLS